VRALTFSNGTCLLPDLDLYSFVRKLADSVLHTLHVKSQPDRILIEALRRWRRCTPSFKHQVGILTKAQSREFRVCVVTYREYWKAEYWKAEYWKAEC